MKLLRYKLKEAIDRRLHGKKPVDDGLCLYPDHPLPSNRREFMASGFYGTMGTVVMPSITTLLGAAGETYAASCEVEEYKKTVPYLCLDLAGGANLAGSNFIVGFRKGGDQMDFDVPGATPTDFIRLGLAAPDYPGNPDKVDHRFGAAMHTGGGWYEGFMEEMGELPEIYEKMSIVIVPCRSGDDTGSNPWNTSYMAHRAGSTGKVVGLAGNRSSDTGGNSTAPEQYINTAIAPSKVGNFDEASNLLGLGVEISNLIRSGMDGGTERARFIFNQIKTMNRAKIDSLRKKNLQEQLAEHIECSGGRASELLKEYSPEVLNPENDPDVQAVFAGEEETAASIASLVINRYAGSGTISLGGYDYHNGTNATGHERDKRAAKIVAKAIRLAAAKGEKLFIHVFSDGSVTGSSTGELDPTNGKVIWTSDSGTRGATLMIAYDPQGRPDTGGVHQIGSFKREGGAHPQDAAGNSIELATLIVAENYRAFAGMKEKTEDIFRRLTDEEKKYIVFKPVA